MKIKKIALVVVALFVSGMALFWYRFMQQHETIKNICRTAVGMNLEALRAIAAREKLRITGPEGLKLMHGAASYGRSVCILEHAPDGTVRKADFHSSIID
ncbi:MAG: hypothetical protein IJM64_09130 [Ottowia sp.]|nr:hypothetical protein [Ottowia sp.]MBQ9578957.1 hypothetical protein [Ottowia sp.]